MIKKIIIPFCRMSMPREADDMREVLKMTFALQGMTWKEIALELTKEFLAWGCPFSRKKLPEIAMGYDCTPLFFWNWMDDPETERTEKGFLRVLGYAWRKAAEEEPEPAPRRRAAALPAAAGRKAA
jgi:hypothetical protein